MLRTHLATQEGIVTAPDIEVDLDYADSILEVIGRCLLVDRKLNSANRGTAL